MLLNVNWVHILMNTCVDYIGSLFVEMKRYTALFGIAMFYFTVRLISTSRMLKYILSSLLPWFFFFRGKRCIAGLWKVYLASDSNFTLLSRILSFRIIEIISLRRRDRVFILGERIRILGCLFLFLNGTHWKVRRLS